VKTQAIRIHEHGGPEILREETVDIGAPAPSEALVRQQAIGLNFADVYQRRGQSGPHGTTSFPVTLGSQGAGIVEAVGADVRDIAVGMRVGYVHPGAYSKHQRVPAARLVPLPQDVSVEAAAAGLLRGLTAQYLLRRLFVIAPGARMLVHAAAGGMGAILSQWGRALGARVAGTVGSTQKAAIALAHGCDCVIDYSREDFVARTLEWSDGAGVDVVYDAVGKAVFVRSLDCLRPMGMAINYGAASGPVGPFDIQLLHAKSLIVSRPTLRTYIARREDLLNAAQDFFAVVRSGAVRIDISRRYAWNEIRQAHADLEARATTGASSLTP
jgi:NADPH2:quinone reductase